MQGPAGHQMPSGVDPASFQGHQNQAQPGAMSQSKHIIFYNF